MGWAGDERLVVYLHQPSKVFVLWRLEHDGEYRPTVQMPGTITPQTVNMVIRDVLVRADSRRGFNPADDVIAKVEAVERAVATDRKAQVGEFADKLHWALAHSHLPGVDVAKRTFTISKG